MIAVYALCYVQADRTSEFEQIATELLTQSRQDQGCVSYHYGKVIEKPHCYAFVEHWQSMEDLQSHMSQPHFIQAGEKLSQVLTKELEISLVELV